MRNKGKRLELHHDNYTIIDIETCGLTNELRRHIIELSAIKVRDGVVVEEYSSLVNPQMPIPRGVIDLTGITNDMVKDAEPLSVVLPIYLAFIGDDIVVGYNINTFDYNVIYDVTNDLLGREFSNEFTDVYYAALHSVKDCKHKNLTSLCEHFNIDFSGAHRALRDCYMTKQLYDLLFELYGEETFSGKHCRVNQYEGRGFKYSDETLQLRELQTVLKTIVEDDAVDESEVFFLMEWMDTNSNLRGNYPYDRVFDLLDKVLEDGIVDRDELILLLDKFNEFTDPVSVADKVDSANITIEGKHFVLTGEFAKGTRDEVSKLLESQGGIMDGQVKKCTDFVIVGSLGSQAWKNGTYGGKIKKAMEYKDKGIDINIISESDFFK